MPDADAIARLHPDEAAAVAGALGDGETVRAVATPVPVRRPAVMTGALAFAAAALVASIGLVASGAGMVLAALLALVSLLAVGAADRWGRRTVAYAATDRRLLVVTDSGAGTPRADTVADRALSRRRLDVRSTGRGTIRLSGGGPSIRIGPIADVRAFNAVLETLPGASPSRSGGAAAGPETHLPAPDAFRDADVARIARTLAPGERVLWMGQPEPTWGTKQTMNGVQKKILPTLLPIFVLIGMFLGLAASSNWLDENIAFALPLFQVLTIGYAVWMTRQFTRRSLYVVTDRRALVGMPGALSYDVRSFDGAALAEATTANGAGGRRSVIFGSGAGDVRTVPGYRGGRVRTTGWESWAGGPLGDGFEFIRDADAVADLVRRVGAGEAPSGDLLALRLPERAASGLRALSGEAAETPTSRAIPLPPGSDAAEEASEAAPRPVRTRG